MNSGITRWKIVPVYSGSVVFPFSGCCHSTVPVARATKFATVRGTCFSNSSTVTSPLLVLKIAWRAPSPGIFTSGAGVSGLSMVMKVDAFRLRCNSYAGVKADFSGSARYPTCSKCENDCSEQASRSCQVRLLSHSFRRS